MLDAAIEQYSAPYKADAKDISALGHSFTTVYKKEAAVLGLHADAGTQVQGVWRASVTSRYEMSGLLYLTSAGVDFDGGALVFPYLGDKEGKVITYFPRAGDLVVFPSNPLFAHYVKHSDGERVVMGAWRAWRPYTFNKQGA
jgi:predicted 2-oxoglutarate/Fe(II)-dependent dioxygenase YbiX